MATPQTLANLKNVAQAIKNIDKERLLRPTLGEASIEKEFGPTLQEINDQLDFAVEYAPNVHDNNVAQLVGIFGQIRAALQQQSARSAPDFVAQREAFLASIRNTLNELQLFWPPLVTAAVEARGFLKDEGIRQEYQRVVDEMKEQAEAALKLVKEESARTIGEAKRLAQEIEDKARRTAAHISVEAAQKQFRQAHTDLGKQVILWAALSIASIVGFLGVAVWLMMVKFPEEMKWHIVYYTAIRIVILTAVGAAATFCLRMLRAHMHLREHNRHRERVANSMAAFVESAITPEQRDLILGHLVDAVASFGTSGLLQKEDDSIYSPKMTVDTVMRSFTSPPAK